MACSGIKTHSIRLRPQFIPFFGAQSRPAFPGLGAYSALVPESRITLPHFRISDST